MVIYDCRRESHNVGKADGRHHPEPILPPEDDDDLLEAEDLRESLLEASHAAEFETDVWEGIYA